MPWRGVHAGEREDLNRLRRCPGRISEEAIALTFESLRGQLTALSDRVYLNTGTSGPMPERSFDVQLKLLELITHEGLASPVALAAYSRALDQAREAVASVLSCEPSSVALTHSTSDGIGIVAAGFRWRAGDEVIISDLEHISGIAPWRRLAVEKGIVVRNVPSQGGCVDPERIAAAITSKTKMICMSHVAYPSGAVLPIQEVCARAKEAGVAVVVDGAQAAGHLPLDVEKLGCDFYALPGKSGCSAPWEPGRYTSHPRRLKPLCRPASAGPRSSKKAEGQPPGKKSNSNRTPAGLRRGRSTLPPLPL